MFRNKNKFSLMKIKSNIQTRKANIILILALVLFAIAVYLMIKTDLIKYYIINSESISKLINYITDSEQNNEWQNLYSFLIPFVIYSVPTIIFRKSINNLSVELPIIFLPILLLILPLILGLSNYLYEGFGVILLGILSYFIFFIFEDEFNNFLSARILAISFISYTSLRLIFDVISIFIFTPLWIRGMLDIILISMISLFIILIPFFIKKKKFVYWLILFSLLTTVTTLLLNYNKEFKRSKIISDKHSKNEVYIKIQNNINSKTQNKGVHRKSTSNDLQKRTLSILDSKYLGLYALQLENGNTQFYKFTNKRNSNELNIIYQDNIGGNVKLENYILKSFNEGSSEVTLESKKNSNNIIKVFFKRDLESSNGYKLVDSDGNSYPFVSK